MSEYHVHIIICLHRIKVKESNKLKWKKNIYKYNKYVTH